MSRIPATTTYVDTEISKLQEEINRVDVTKANKNKIPIIEKSHFLEAMLFNPSDLSDDNTYSLLNPGATRIEFNSCTTLDFTRTDDAKSFQVPVSGYYKISIKMFGTVINNNETNPPSFSFGEYYDEPNVQNPDRISTLIYLNKPSPIIINDVLQYNMSNANLYYGEVILSLFTERFYSFIYTVPISNPVPFTSIDNLDTSITQFIDDSTSQFLYMKRFSSVSVIYLGQLHPI